MQSRHRPKTNDAATAAGEAVALDSVTGVAILSVTDNADVSARPPTKTAQSRIKWPRERSARCTSAPNE
jgi:hypothetical protein